jgi:hypothetical protein
MGKSIAAIIDFVESSDKVGNKKIINTCIFMLTAHPNKSASAKAKSGLTGNLNTLFLTASSLHMRICPSSMGAASSSLPYGAGAKTS